jgi:biotin operon repressor
MSWAWQQDTPNASAKLVLLAIADHANGDGYCWPSMGRIGRMVGLSLRQVSNHVTALEAAGLVVKAERRRHAGQLRGWTYHVPFDRPKQQEQAATTGSPLPVASGNAVPPPAAAHCRTEPPGNHQVEPLRRKRREPDLLFEALCEAGGHRLDGLTAVERGRINKAAKELREAGATPDDVQVAAQAWVRLYPNTTVTVMALATHWSRLMEQRRSRPGGAAACKQCGGALQGHDDELCAAFAD